MADPAAAPAYFPPTLPSPAGAPAQLSAAALPALPGLPSAAPPAPPSSSAISPSPGAQPTPSGSATPLPQTDATPAPAAKGKGKGKAVAAGKTKADEPPDGEPKPKKKRSAKKPGEPGPGKSWRKGLKGNLAGVGLDPTIAASLHTGGTASPAGSSPAPARSAVVGSTSAVGAPPKLNNQFLAANPLHIGTPRPRRWIKTKIAFKRVDGMSIALPSWQGDSYSAYATAALAAQTDELASPPPLRYASPHAAPAPKPRASTHVAASHLMTPTLSTGASPTPPAPVLAAGETGAGPLGYQALRPPVLPPIPGMQAQATTGVQGPAETAAQEGA
ncbi:hypothetical protein JCM10450v2_002707 [Rhodotorula kratochvilovae]